MEERVALNCLARLLALASNMRMNLSIAWIYLDLQDHFTTAIKMCFTPINSKYILYILSFRVKYLKTNDAMPLFGGMHE